MDEKEDESDENDGQRFPSLLKEPDPILFICIYHEVFLVINYFSNDDIVGEIINAFSLPFHDTGDEQTNVAKNHQNNNDDKKENKDHSFISFR